MDVSVTGRHCHISDDFRTHVIDRMTSIEKLSEKVIRVEVQVSAYGNKRQPEESARVEITLRGKGPVVRAEAQAQEKLAAFEQALDRLRSQLRKAADRKKVHRGNHAPKSLREATALLPEQFSMNGSSPEEESDTHTVAGIQVTGDGPLVVREKEHRTEPMTLERALDEMELVGHDFFLFVDAASGKPSVVYRRKAYDYGVIRLDLSDAVVPTA
ncbi:ribosome hibernation-promoting factor, HPF/YfiA family [Enemella evansiae]|uniref:Ribosome hibernation promoting factor n=1 Tax=Enemella evansiae TaxID=2016499 RepID=A0A255GFA1_9ACTN|nr:ribosome-associated translation inhibitor RaiA [Enemella evansiae]PFG67661.1 ribosomal subunit interface protein [Propionibacteriaceae bacterium ES.041]OYN94599.1 ribosomal subunit interface protein [Enemella evansiae]OYO01149.1 ribosomal subunit interface protein [Enemella evansiae]OYO05128.1 ribosomal subunit interface protein [Enemella evansiae]OYO07593.1 ribosomal subunit interface protein [Enemella evansiae]